MCQIRQTFAYFFLACLLILASAPEQADGLIITSVIAGNKKFKTVSFDSKFLKPLTFEKDLPSTEFRRHRTVRPPKFDIDVNIPIKLPLEDEYNQVEYKKPVESNIFFQSGEIIEPKYGQKSGNNYVTGEQQYAASSETQEASQPSASPSVFMRDGLKGLLPTLAKSIKFTPKIEFNSASQASNARSDYDALNQLRRESQVQASRQLQTFPSEPMEQADSYSASSYAPRPQYQSERNQQDFVPGGFINLQLSGPTGGPKMTYEDYDKERWAQQLSQTEGAMPYPYLNYHQLQNFYGGLGTFTNGLAEHRYVEHGVMDKFKSSLNHLTSKFHIG